MYISERITLEDLTNGLIVSRQHADEEGNQPHTFEWQGGPFCRITREFWRHIWPDVGQRHLCRARLGPFYLLLMDQDPAVPYDIWYREPPRASMGRR